MATIDHHDDIRPGLKTPRRCGWHHGETMTMGRRTNYCRRPGERPSRLLKKLVAQRFGS
jgi:hypothetical protein